MKPDPRRMTAPNSATQPQIATPAIQINGLTKTFGNQHAVRNLSLDVPQGKFLTIFGPNGAGKTTLIRILSSITKATSGTIRINGLTVSEAAEQIRRQIGVIAHHTYLYDNLTAEENLRFYGKLYSVSELEAKVGQIIADVGLTLRSRDPVRTFSRGMQQRLSIARAMLHEPNLLFLDEPYTGLDQHASEMLTGWLRKLKSSHRTTLMVTHDLERGIDLADSIAILNRGNLVFNQPRQDIDPATFRDTYYRLVSGEGGTT